jgi:hypothetical protein
MTSWSLRTQEEGEGYGAGDKDSERKVGRDGGMTASSHATVLHSRRPSAAASVELIAARVARPPCRRAVREHRLMDGDLLAQPPPCPRGFGRGFCNPRRAPARPPRGRTPAMRHPRPHPPGLLIPPSPLHSRRCKRPGATVNCGWGCSVGEGWRRGGDGGSTIQLCPAVHTASAGPPRLRSRFLQPASRARPAAARSNPRHAPPARPPSEASHPPLSVSFATTKARVADGSV